MKIVGIIFLVLFNSILYAQADNNQSNKSDHRYLGSIEISNELVNGNCDSETLECMPLRAKDGSGTKLTSKDFDINYDCDNGKRDINSQECITAKRRIYGK